jgi:hypothetical protein
MDASRFSTNSPRFSFLARESFFHTQHRFRRDSRMYVCIAMSIISHRFLHVPEVASNKPFLFLLPDEANS